MNSEASGGAVPVQLQLQLQATRSHVDTTWNFYLPPFFFFLFFFF